jgi:hypothetical protein
MSASIRSKFVLPAVSALAVFALSAHAEDAAPAPPQPPQTPAQPAQQPVAKTMVQTQKSSPGRSGQGAGQGQGAHVARGALPARKYGGQTYRGRVAWEGGRWHHEIRDGRDGWWWDVGGAWYYYSEPMEGPPTYIS